MTKNNCMGEKNLQEIVYTLNILFQFQYSVFFEFKTTITYREFWSKVNLCS